MTRRVFLRIAAAFLGATAVAVVGFRQWRTRNAAGGRRLYDRLANPEIEPTATGHLAALVMQTLLSVSVTLVDEAIDSSRYEDFFRWRARNVRGYKTLYEKLAGGLDRAASESGYGSFSDCDAENRRRILAAFLPSEKGALSRLLNGIIDRDVPRFERYVVREILELFNRTDSWMRLGYEACPGIARGLDRYTRAPGADMTGNL